MLFSTNPYVAGNPVGDSPAFVGRADILRKVLQVLRHPKENAIVLYGQRRIGKTSVLQELEAKLPKQGNYYPIFFDLQDQAQWPLARVLSKLAQKISDKLRQEPPNLGDDPETTFGQVWLPNLLNNLSQEASLVFLFDEFDVLDDPESEKAAATFFPYLRDLLTINQKHLNFVFVIGRKVDDLTNIALSLFKTIPASRVSLLNKQDTIALIRMSEANNSLIWSNDAIEIVWQLTGGHPFLTQRLCSCIFERLYDNNPEESPTVAPKNVNAVIPDVLYASRNALEWLWNALPPVERMIISVLASAGAKPIPKNQLEELLHKNGIQFAIHELQTLEDWDLIEFVEDGYCFRVELLRRCIADYKPLSQVRKELDRIEPTADSLYQTGLGFYRVGQLDVSLTFLRQAVASNPNHVGANQLLAEILLKQGLISEARELLEKLYKHQPAVARSQLIQVLLSLAQNSDNESEQLLFYERVLELDREHPHPEAKKGKKKFWQKRGDNAYDKGDFKIALDAYRKAEIQEKIVEIQEKIQIQAQLPEWYQRAQFALQQGDKQKAQTFFAKIIAIDPEYKEVSRYLHLAVTNVDPNDLINVIQSLGPSNQKLKKSNPKWLLVFIAMTIFSVVVTTSILFSRETRIMPSETQELEKIRLKYQKIEDGKKELQARLIAKEQYIEKKEERIRQLETQLPRKHPKFQSLLHVVVVETYDEDKKQDALRKVKSLNAKSNIGTGMFSTSDKMWLVNVGGFFYSLANAKNLKKRAVRELRESDAYIHTIDMNIIDNIMPQRNIAPPSDPSVLKSLQSGRFVVIVATYVARKHGSAQQKVVQLKANYPELSTLKVNRYKVSNGNWRVYIGSFSKSSANTFKDWAIERGITKNAYIAKK